MGCSCQPSPALITLAPVQPATWWGTPADRWRTTMAWGPMAEMVWTVSRTDSPLFTDEADTLNPITSADSRRAAISNESRVRVESS